MITTNNDGEFVSLIYTVSNGNESIVVGSAWDLQKKLRISQGDAEAIIFGDSKIKGYELSNTTEVGLHAVN